MPVTDEDLGKQQAKLEKMREQLADATAAREDRERELARELDMKRLKAEEARLQGELNLAKEMAKVKSVRAGSADLVESVEEQERASTVQAESVASAAGKE